MNDNAPAGWYAHPTMAGTQRYWDGERWTDNIAPGAPPHTRADGGNTETLITAGWVTAIFLPVAGFV